MMRNGDEGIPSNEFIREDSNNTQQSFQIIDGHSESKTSKGTKKITVACEYCRTHHRKCNGASPCSNCIEKNIECVFTAGKKRGPKNDALKRMKTEMDSLKNDIENLKQSEQNWKKRYSEATHTNTSPVSNGQPHTIEDERASKRRRVIGMPQKGELQAILGGEQSFVLSSLINDFVSIYETYIHPSHPLLPTGNYSSLLPELISRIVRDDSDSTSSFYVFSLLCNGALITGNKQLSTEFFERARQHAGDVFDVVDPRVGCGFSMLAYYQLCVGNCGKSVLYANIAKGVAESLGLLYSHLHMNSILGVAFVSENYEERMKLFQIMSHSKQTADLVFCLAGQVITEIKYRENPNYTSLMELLMRAMRIQNEADVRLYHTSGDKILLDVLLNAALIMTLRKAKFHQLALEYSRKLLLMSTDSQFNYLCVGVACCALEAAADVLIEQGQEHELNQIFFILEKLSIKYELCIYVMKAIRERSREHQMQQQQLYLASKMNSTVNTQMLLNGVVQHEQYIPQTMMVNIVPHQVSQMNKIVNGMNIPEHSLYN